MNTAELIKTLRNLIDQCEELASRTGHRVSLTESYAAVGRAQPSHLKPLPAPLAADNHGVWKSGSRER